MMGKLPVCLKTCNVNDCISVYLLALPLLHIIAALILHYYFKLLGLLRFIILFIHIFITSIIFIGTIEFRNRSEIFGSLITYDRLDMRDKLFVVFLLFLQVFPE